VAEKRGAGESPDLELSSLTLGESRLIGVLGAIKAGPIDEDDILSFDLALPEIAHVYESRSGTYQGKTKLINHRTPRGIARVYAALPYRVKDVSIGGPHEVRQGDLLRLEIAVNANDGKPGTHVVHVSVLGPADDTVRRRERIHYARNLRAEDGRARTTIPLAHNDTPGEWTIVAKDAATGVTGRKTVRVSAKKKDQLFSPLPQLGRSLQPK